MLTLPPHAAVLLHRQPVDIRKSFDGLLGVIRNALAADPLSPTFFVFFDKDRNKIKILHWDHDGFAIWYKRLEKGAFHLTLPHDGETSVKLTRAQEERIRTECGGPFKRIGEERGESLHFKPMELFVLVTILLKYVAACDCSNKRSATAESGRRRS